MPIVAELELHPRQPSRGSVWRRYRTLRVLLLAVLIPLVPLLHPIGAVLGRHRLIIGRADRRDKDWGMIFALAYYGFQSGDMELEEGSVTWWRLMVIGDQAYGVQWSRPVSQRLRAARKAPSGRLIRAAREGNLPGVKASLAAGADVNAVLDEQTALGAAVAGNDTAVVEFLLGHGADVNQAGGGGELLRLAVMEGKSEILRALLAHGVDPDSRDEFGRTALMNAVLWDQEALVKELLGREVDLSARDSEGTTAMTLAEMEGDRGIVKLLKQAAARP